MIPRKLMMFMSLLLTAFVLSWTYGPALAANNKPNKPILTKSGKKAALEQAAAAILQAAPEAVLQALPVSPTDETKVPHYFGPFPNWANSPFTLPDVAVVIEASPLSTPTDPTPTATATATVNAIGEVTGFTITNPGFGYTSPPGVAITDAAGTNTSATATAEITTTGVVTAITVDAGGAGYTAPAVDILLDGGGTGATATAYGGVPIGGVTITNPGSGYTFPTVDFDMPDGPNGVKATASAECDGLPAGTGCGATGAITAIIVDQPGSGYTSPPNVVIRNGTIFDPIPGATPAAATATLYIQTVVLDTFGTGYTSAPTVDITDPTGSGAMATAIIDVGAVTTITLTAPGTGYLTAGGIKKFQDGLPLLCNPSVAGSCVPNNLGQYLPLAVPDTTTFLGDPTRPDADYYVIALVQVRERMSSSLHPQPGQGALVREYVQLETPANASWSKSIALQTALPDGTTTATLMPDGSPAVAVDNPHFLGPLIMAQKDKPVRIVFYNLLPAGSDGDLFMPTDSTIMGSGPHPDADPALFDPLDEGTVLDAVRNPVCTEYPKSDDCFKDNRATLHLHGGITPWISDGTPHQWITPASQTTPWPEGVSVGNVPDMAGPNVPLGVPDCSAKTDGCQTFYYTNQQSARLMFYHDHAWGITRLNVYAGEAAGYLISDPTEQALLASGTIPADQIPLVIQDRTFVPQKGDGVTPGQLDLQDPTWDSTRWGGYGDLWYHHVYMPAQNPGDPTGMSAFGRWMYGPWFWPPATPPHGPIANPYYTGTCNPADSTTWQYDTDPFCEPELIPGTPNISVGMEQFNDTPIVNGTAYPTTTVEPKSYRFRILNAANDRFWNLQWYVADSTGTEVALNPAELAAAQLDPNIFPTPDTTVSLPGPDWIVIGNEGGFLPAPVVVDGQQPTTWIIDPTVFNVGNVDLHSLLVAPAERFDVIVDFSQHAGQTLILYNDAPAAFPARVASYDYYTGAPDLSPVGAPAILPGYGPNTRTIMQVKVEGAAAPAFNLTALQNAFRHKADGTGVFESGQHPIIVGQAEYNSAYGTSFVASGNCNGGSTSTDCDGHLRIADQGGTLFGFNTLLAPNAKLQIPIEPKAIHDEMNASAFDEFGRMTANIGLEAVPATPALQNIILYPYVNPPTELIDGTYLPKNDINPLTMTPISPISSADGTQIWKITHNGVDTHPLHWHLYDVQVLNRVTWDNIVSPPDPTELGWKDTLRVSPLEDTIVALRPIIPQLPFELPNSIRPLHPMMPTTGPMSMMGFNNVDAAGNPTDPIVNQLINFGLEYVWHCHILSHEEMDMMRPVAVAMPPYAPTVNSITKNGSTVRVTFDDNSITETSFQLQRTADSMTWTNVGTPLVSPLNLPNDPRTGLVLTNSGVSGNPGPVYGYRVAAVNTVGYGGAFPTMSAQSISNTGLSGNAALPAAPTNLTAALAAGPRVNLTWTDTATNENGFIIQRSSGGAFTQIGTAPARNNTGSATFADTSVVLGNTYTYRVAAVNGAGLSTFATFAGIAVAVPAVPTGVTAANGTAGGQRTAGLNWTAVAGATSYSVLWSNSSTMAPATQVNNATSGGQINVGNPVRTVYMQVRANNVLGSSAWTPSPPSPPVAVLAQ